jgi:hypothetical protein
MFMLAMAGVLTVLITPALDELPCVGKHIAYHTAPPTTILPFLTLPSAFALYRCSTVAQLPRITDILSSNCTLVC